MANTRARRGHTGRTTSGSVRDVKVQRIGRVTVYKRGKSYYLYYREKGKSIRRKVDGNLATARAMASRTSAALEESRPSPFTFTRVTVATLVDDFVDYCESVKGLAYRTVDRYRSALAHLKEFAEEEVPTSRADEVTLGTVEDFVRWLRKQPRTRNGADAGLQRPYAASGIAFVLSTCRTAFNWAAKRRLLPPYSDNPFAAFPVETITQREEHKGDILTAEQQQAFFEACDDWQRPVFLTLALYGLRVGELTHLLISDLDQERAVLRVRSKPEMFWNVKTGNERLLPLLPELSPLFEGLVAGRKAGFLFLNRDFAERRKHPCKSFASRREFRLRLQEVTDEARDDGITGEKELLRAIRPFLRAMGQIPEKRVRQEFMRLTKRIGCPELTRVHSLRHLFSTRAQESGINPFVVQGILGHSSLDMTGRYTHLGLEARRRALGQMLEASNLPLGVPRNPKS